MVVGITVTDDAMRKASIIQKAIFKKAEELLVGKNAVPIQRVNNIDIRLALPKATYLQAQEVAEGARADMQTVEWFNTNISMSKYQAHVLVTNEAIARGLIANQLKINIDAAAKGLQIAKDQEIFTSLLNGAGQTVAVTTKWNATGATPEDDIASAIQKIADNTVITDADLKNMALFVPAGLMGFMKKRVEVENIRVPLERAIADEFGIKIFYTRHLTTDALLIVKSNETAIHFEYNGSDVPTVEEERVAGVGTRYLITQYFKTVVIPDSDTVSTSSRICKLTNVA